MFVWRAPALLLVASSLVACAPTPPPNTPEAPPVTPLAPVCAGSVDTIDGLKDITDDSMMKDALGAPGKGNLCTARAFEVTKPLVVYRVWDRSKPPTEMGRWWSFSRPAGPREAYRAANVICAEWSALDVVTQCKLKVGTHVVLGPGQSAICASGALGASATNQVFVPNDTRDPQHPKVFVDGCNLATPWP